MLEEKKVRIFILFYIIKVKATLATTLVQKW